MTLAVIVTVVTLTAIHIITCALHPFTNCARCAGSGKHQRWYGGINTCHHCHGHGKRLRPTLRAVSYLIRLHTAADRAAARKAATK